MISVVIPTLNAADTLAECLSALIPAAVDALVHEVVVVDGGSTDLTFDIADDAGAKFVTVSGDVEARIAAGCAAAKGPWILVLHPNVRLGSEWIAAAKAHVADHPRSAGHFRLALDDHRLSARLREVGAGLVGRGGEGLLAPKRTYEEAKGRPSTRPLAARAFRI